MSEKDETVDEVVVSVGDLQKMRDGLNLAYWKSVSEDMVQAYKTVDVDGRRSKSALTTQLEDALQVAEAATKLADDDTRTPDTENPEPSHSS